MKTALRWSAVVAVAMTGLVWGGTIQAQGPGAIPAEAAMLGAAPARWDDMNRVLARQPEVEEALRRFGYTPGRLARRDEQALQVTFRELYSGRDLLRDRLNRTQATALVYMALVHDGRDDRWGRAPGRQACEAPARRIFALEELYEAPGRGRPRFLRQEEQMRLAEEAREIARFGRSCGELGLVEEARILTELLAERRPERDRVARQVERMKSLTRAPGGWR